MSRLLSFTEKRVRVHAPFRHLEDAAAAIASVVSECCGGGDGGLLEFHQGRQWHERRLL